MIDMLSFDGETGEFSWNVNAGLRWRAWLEVDGRRFGSASRPPGERGNVFLHAPATVAVANPRGHSIAKDGGDDSLVIRVALDFAADAARWAVSFKKL